MKQAVDAISHHYASDSTARSSLATWIREGVIDEVEIRREGRALRLYPRRVTR